MAHRMLQAQQSQSVFRYQNFHINKSQPLGHGSYGAVYKAKCDQLPCAAKVLHPTILYPNDPGAGKIMNRFQQECAFLERIRHPNIVQYLGMTSDPESRLPVLLMELLDESLTKMLEHSQQSLAYYIQVDICHDIALAVAYLHSNDIIHRDLSSNNVLMIAGKRAKVTDFGMSTLAGAAPSMTPLTMCPGTLAYMPPEALREPPRYTKKLDCFSEGVIMIQVCTLLWPEPGPRTQMIQDFRYPMGVVEAPVCEMERRKAHVDLIDPNHALLPIVNNCLQFQDKDRPSSDELCQRLAGLKESREYKESVQTHHDEILTKDNQIIAQQLQEKDRLLEYRSIENASLAQLIQDKNLQIEQHQEELSSQERQLREEISSRERQFRQLLEEQEQVTAEIQQTNYSLQRQVEQLQQQLSQQSLKSPQPLPSSQAQVWGRQFQERESRKQLPVQPHSQNIRKLTLNWRDGGTAPLRMYRGAAMVDGDMAYFLHMYGDIYSYDSCSNKWRMLPKYPYYFSSLAVVNGQLTAIGGLASSPGSGDETSPPIVSSPEPGDETIGGFDDNESDLEGLDDNLAVTNKLLSLQAGRRWRKIFPPMPTKRSSVAAVTTKEHLIVTGGDDANGFGHEDVEIRSSIFTRVELMDKRTLVWSIVASLPHPYTEVSVTICGDQLYMLGGADDKDKTKSVLTCSLTELLQSSSSRSSSIWYRVADAPAYRSTCAAVNGELLAVGGYHKLNHTKPSSTIHKYNPTTNSWDLISNMPTARYRSLVTVLPTNEMMVIGGYDEDGNHRIVEIANIIL